MIQKTSYTLNRTKKLFFTSLWQICIVFVLFVSCKKEIRKPEVKNSLQTVKYAKGFDIVTHKNYTDVILFSKDGNVKDTHIIILKNNENIIPDKKNSIILKKPVKRIVATSTTHIPMLELLNQENSLVGFPNTKYISSEKTRALIKANKITELGKEQSINTELLLDLKPDVVVGFTVGSNNNMFENIKKAGIPVIINSDWLEKSPLGRAEWIKFFGALFQKEKMADSIFNEIEKKYNKAKKIALQAKNKPKILSGVLYKDKWNLPAGESYVAQFLKDANVNYPWQNTKGNGSLSLAFESVFDKVKDADFWIAPGYYESYLQLEKANQHYKEFDAFKQKKIYNFTDKKGETGGVLYYELAPVQPDIVLKDIIKTVHPELLPDYTPFYLNPIE